MITKLKKNLFTLTGLMVVGLLFLELFYVPHLEKDNKFCLSCHLHKKIYDDFLSVRKGKTLSSRHGKEKGFICIDCHVGPGLIGRINASILGASNAVTFLTTRYKEPGEMKSKMGDEHCIKCHTNSEMSSGKTVDDYHGRIDHYDVSTRCVQCHISHIEGNPSLKFLKDERVIPFCKECHPGMYNN